MGKLQMNCKYLQQRKTWSGAKAYVQTNHLGEAFLDYDDRYDKMPETHEDKDDWITIQELNPLYRKVLDLTEIYNRR